MVGLLAGDFAKKQALFEDDAAFIREVRAGLAVSCSAALLDCLAPALLGRRGWRRGGAGRAGLPGRAVACQGARARWAPPALPRRSCSLIRLRCSCSCCPCCNAGGARHGP